MESKTTQEILRELAERSDKVDGVVAIVFHKPDAEADMGRAEVIGHANGKQLLQAADAVTRTLIDQINKVAGKQLTSSLDEAAAIFARLGQMTAEDITARYIN